MTYKVTAWFQQERDYRFEPYSGKGTFRKSALTLDVEAASIESVPEWAWRQYNADNRANGKTERSLSVGDLIEVVRSDSRGGGGDWFAAEVVGFRAVPPPWETATLLY